jgi:hypothetical protein
MLNLLFAVLPSVDAHQFRLKKFYVEEQNNDKKMASRVDA